MLIAAGVGLLLSALLHVVVWRVSAPSLVGLSMMGIFIGVVAVGIALLAVRSLRRVDGPPSTALAIRAGMIFLLLGQVLGGLILANQFSSSRPTGCRGWRSSHSSWSARPHPSAWS